MLTAGHDSQFPSNCHPDLGLSIETHSKMVCDSSLGSASVIGGMEPLNVTVPGYYSAKELLLKRTGCFKGTLEHTKGMVYKKSILWVSGTNPQNATHISYSHSVMVFTKTLNFN